jgi:hypothetical protein
MCNQTQQFKSPMTRNPSETATDETIYHEKDARPLRSYTLLSHSCFFRHGMRKLFRVVYHKRARHIFNKSIEATRKISRHVIRLHFKAMERSFCRGKTGRYAKKILSQRMIVELLFCKTAMRNFSNQRIVEYELLQAIM